MKSRISFTTDLFESNEAAPSSKNVGCLGEDLANWVVERSRGGEFAFGEPFQDGKGWAIPVAAESEKFTVGLAIQDESIGDDQADWLITVERIRKWKLFGSGDSALRSRLCDLIQNVLRDGAHIREVRWDD
jgi:hypothetical protein